MLLLYAVVKNENGNLQIEGICHFDAAKTLMENGTAITAIEAEKEEANKKLELVTAQTKECR